MNFAVFVSLIGALFGISGGLFLLWKSDIARKFSIYFVAFASGTLLGASFLNIIPKAVNNGDVHSVMFSIIVGFLVVLILEKFLMIYHCHDHECDIHDAKSRSFIGAIIFGDTLHNFVDGIAIAVAFSIDPKIGLATAIAIFSHELPQEIGDFGVLLHAGLSKFKVMLFNIASALATPIGTVVGIYFGYLLEPIRPLILGFVAGNFIYVAASDLIPHLKEEWDWRKSASHVVLIISGIALIWFILQFNGVH